MVKFIEDHETIWGRTRSARIKAGIKSAGDMVEKFGEIGIIVSEPAYYKYETRSKIRDDLLVAFCSITGINKHWLLTGEGEILYEQTKSEQLYDLLDRAAEEAKERNDAFASETLKMLMERQKK